MISSTQAHAIAAWMMKRRAFRTARCGSLAIGNGRRLWSLVAIKSDHLRGDVPGAMARYCTNVLGLQTNAGFGSPSVG
jgi:hypothetical protein